MSRRTCPDLHADRDQVGNHTKSKRRILVIELPSLASIPPHLNPLPEGEEATGPLSPWERDRVRADLHDRVVRGPSGPPVGIADHALGVGSRSRQADSPSGRSSGWGRIPPVRGRYPNVPSLRW